MELRGQKTLCVRKRSTTSGNSCAIRTLGGGDGRGRASQRASVWWSKRTHMGAYVDHHHAPALTEGSEERTQARTEHRGGCSGGGGCVNGGCVFPINEPVGREFTRSRLNVQLRSALLTCCCWSQQARRTKGPADKATPVVGGAAPSDSADIGGFLPSPPPHLLLANATSLEGDMIHWRHRVERLRLFICRQHTHKRFRRRLQCV